MAALHDKRMLASAPMSQRVRSLCCGMSVAAMLCAGQATAQSISVSCGNAILTDAETRSVLFEKEADSREAPASTAKLMTAELVFQQIAAGKLKLDDTFQISEHAWRAGGAPSGGSSMFAQLNSRVRIEDLIRGLVIQSGNDAAIALAEGIAGTEEAFGRMMTARARELGMMQSTFVNPWGKGDPEQKVTARDMTLLASHLVRTYPDLYKYFSEKEFTWNKIRQMNRNPLLFMDIGADGLKTGDIAESGFGLVGSAVQNGQRLFVVLNNCRAAKDRAEDGRKLLLWGFRSFDRKSVFTAGETVGTAKVYGGVKGDVALVADRPIVLFLPRGSSEKLQGKVVYEGPIPAPVEKGTKVASLKVWRGSSLVLDTPLRAAEDVPLGPLHRRAFDAGLEYGGSLIRHYVLRK